jgi:hypothetical protein
MEIYDIEPFPGILRKAAGLLYSFAGPFHPYVDGNKRTALILVQVFLLVNGYSFHVPEKENTLKFVIAIAQDQINDIGRIAKWLEASSVKNELFALDEETKLKLVQNKPTSLYDFELTLKLERKLNGSSNNKE